MLLFLCAFHPAELQVIATAGCLQLQLKKVFSACSCCASIVALQEAQECKHMSLHGSKYMYSRLYQSVHALGQLELDSPCHVQCFGV